MKMTKTEWRYLQKIALDHPYYDTHQLPLTEAEAEAIAAANNGMTGREFTDSVYQTLGIPRPVEKQKRFARLGAIGSLLAVPPIRRIVIAVLAVLLLIVFFVATPTGRAVAESVVRYVVTLFDDGHMIISRSDETAPELLAYDGIDAAQGQASIENTVEHMRVDSFDAFAQQTGKTPMVLPLPCEERYYIYCKDIDLLILYASYDTPNGRIITSQIWGAAFIVSSASANFAVYDADKQIYYATENDGVTCERVLDDSIFTVSAKSGYTLEDLAALLINE